MNLMKIENLSKKEIIAKLERVKTFYPNYEYNANLSREELLQELITQTNAVIYDIG